MDIIKVYVALLDFYSNSNAHPMLSGVVRTCVCMQHMSISIMYTMYCTHMTEKSLKCKMHIKNFDAITVSVRKSKRFAQTYLRTYSTFFHSLSFSPICLKLFSKKKQHKFAIIVSTRMHFCSHVLSKPSITHTIIRLHSHHIHFTHTHTPSNVDSDRSRI